MLEKNILLKESLESFPNFVIVNSDGKIEYLNNVYAKLLGVEQEKAIGADVEDIIPGTRMKYILKSGVAEIGAVMSFYDHSKEKNVTLICNRFPVKYKGKIIGAVAMTTINSISELEILNREIEKIKNENVRIKKQLVQYKENLHPLSKVIGNSLIMKELKQSIADYAQSNFPILIMGETGVGKEVFANAIHQMSNRALNNYIKINCASIPKELLESELFGYEEGAFSGAKKGGKIGKFELANNGTILLDEIGEMPLTLQTKLLRVFQEKEIERIGGLKPIKLNIRIVCCTNSNLKKMVEEKKFREDLYYRINMVEINIPPLREHIEDIPILCEYFIKKINEEELTEITGISEEVLEIFKEYKWPGNIRELEHIIERASFLCKKGIIKLEHCKFFIDKLETNKDVIMKEEKNSLKEVAYNSEKSAILEALKISKNNRTKAALLLGINRSLLYSKMKKYGIK